MSGTHLIDVNLCKYINKINKPGFFIFQTKDVISAWHFNFNLKTVGQVENKKNERIIKNCPNCKKGIERLLAEAFCRCGNFYCHPFCKKRDGFHNCQAKNCY